jgi:hypothetical protein
VEDRDQHRDRELRVEPERDVGADHEQREDQRFEGAVRDLFAERRPDAGAVEPVPDDPEAVVERPRGGVDAVGFERLRLDLEDVVAEFGVGDLLDLLGVDPDPNLETA